MLGKWNAFYAGVEKPFPYGDVTTYKKAIDFLEDGCEIIHDWGCGAGFAGTLVKKAQYVGIDGSWSRMAHVIADLREFRNEVDGILMRHILEHNFDWKLVLENALASFKKKFVLILFTPFVEATREIAMNEIGVPDMAFRKEDLTGLLKPFRFTEESLKTNTQYGVEHIFYITK